MMSAGIPEHLGHCNKLFDIIGDGKTLNCRLGGSIGGSVQLGDRLGGQT